jgi:hypothetical protein
MTRKIWISALVFRKGGGKFGEKKRMWQGGERKVGENEKGGGSEGEMTGKGKVKGGELLVGKDWGGGREGEMIGIRKGERERGVNGRVGMKEW